MRKVMAIVAACVAASGAVAVQAQQTKTVEKTTVKGTNGSTTRIELLKTGKHLETVSCRDYNSLEATFRPQAIVYAANYGPHGHAHPTMTVDGVERFVPAITASCRARPGDHFVGAVDRAVNIKK